MLFRSDQRLTIAQPAGQPDVLVADLGPVARSLHGPVSIVWRSVSSDDGHVATGTLHFVFGATRAAAPAPAATDSGLGSTVFMYGGGLAVLCLAFGGILLVTTRRARR